MGWMDRFFPSRQNREVRALEDPSVVFGDEFVKWLGAGSGPSGPITLEKALQVPAVAAALNFLSGTMASLPLHLMRSVKNGSERDTSALGRTLHDAPNEEMTSFELRHLFWFGFLSEGRGLIYIERGSRGTPLALWHMDPQKARIKRERGRKVYHYEGQNTPYPASDVIDLAWLPRNDGLGHYSPIQRGARAIHDMLALQEYSSSLFSNGGVPPLVLKGKLPTTGKGAFQRAQADIQKAIDHASKSGSPIAQIPTGFELDKLGFDPKDGQMIEAKKFGIEEIARLFGLPPVFLQDLSNGTYSNTEQQDMHLVKHRIVQLAVAFEQQCNLKLFGRANNRRYVKHNVDGLLRGDFKSRMEGLARGVNSAIYTPNEARGLLDLPASDQPIADDLHMQGATVPIGENTQTGNNDD